ncbi:TIGR02281 family clan AA aspartic protease [Winogradskyella sp. SM1960]|uniref:retropepsin-like aspartic protease family protein n=1 Tax=Winogradskyella sp. SM1960 TaxID=2865955 RepID=UPI001CD30A6A|nr:retropepsin-like aspartic protease [Winogradskyella sp. SM1960]
MIRNCFLIMLICLLFTCKRATSSSSSSSSSSDNSRYPAQSYQRNGGDSKNTVKMDKQGGVFFIPIEINDIAMKIIFDTGASSVSISETEAIFLLKQGKLTEEDFLGKVQFQDATGNISEGTRLNLKKVKIGIKTIYNIEASVVHNLEAPLLLGQSALSKFGKLTINYNKNEIVFD